MRILVLGAGAIGGYYGARLIEAGAAVTFLVRSGRRARMEKEGLRLESEGGHFSQPVPLLSANEVGGPFDLVLLTCKEYDLPAAMDSIAPFVEGGTRVLPVLNGLGAYDALDARFGRDRILGGAAYVVVTLGDDGVIRQMGKADTVFVGARTEAQTALATSFYGLISRTPGARTQSANIELTLWQKWVTLASGGAMCSLMRGNLREILATFDGESLMRQQIAECAAVAAASGYPLDGEPLDAVHAYLLNKRSEWAASLMRDIAQGRPKLEARALVGDMLDRARRLGVPAPLTTAAWTHLRVYMDRHGQTD